MSMHTSQGDVGAGGDGDGGSGEGGSGEGGNGDGGRGDGGRGDGGRGSTTVDIGQQEPVLVLLLNMTALQDPGMFA